MQGEQIFQSSNLPGLRGLDKNVPLILAVDTKTEDLLGVPQRLTCKGTTFRPGELQLRPKPT
jgi:hypothetical protein